MQKAERQSNIELLRIVLMLMIITHHFIVHGLELKSIGSAGYGNGLLTYGKLAINSIVIVAVDVFIFISGFYGMRLRWGSLLSLIGQAVFYSVGLYLIFALGVFHNWNIADFSRSLFPIFSYCWWYLTIFVALMLIAPFLNKGAEILERNQFKLLVAGLLFMDCILGFLQKNLAENGYSIFNFITIYLLARYIGRFGIQVKKPLVYFIVLALLHTAFSSALFYFGKRGLSWEYFMYHNPLIILSASFLFMAFYQLNVASNKIINTLSGLVLGVYLLHDYGQVREKIAEYVQLYKPQMPGGWFVVCIILAIPSVFIVSACIEYARQWIFRLTIDKFILNIDANPRLNSLSNRTVNILISTIFVLIFGLFLFFRIQGW